MISCASRPLSRLLSRACAYLVYQRSCSASSTGSVPSIEETGWQTVAVTKSLTLGPVLTPFDCQIA
uniref:Uncharacterized protein n=1 Tax=Triticum urartu TaxID=4572 RepID=A0A8R7URQ3_TRIUA